MTRKVTEENKRRLAEWEATGDVAPSAIECRKALKEGMPDAEKRGWIGILVLICIFGCCCWIPGQLSNQTAKKEAHWTCIESGSPFKVVQLRDGTVDVYGGANTPQPSRVKGQAGGRNIVGIEASCSGTPHSFYRVRGLDTDGELWWGWVKQGDTREIK